MARCHASTPALVHAAATRGASCAPGDQRMRTPAHSHSRRPGPGGVVLIRGGAASLLFPPVSREGEVGSGFSWRRRDWRKFERAGLPWPRCLRRGRVFLPFLSRRIDVDAASRFRKPGRSFKAPPASAPSLPFSSRNNARPRNSGQTDISATAARVVVERAVLRCHFLKSASAQARDAIIAVLVGRRSGNL